MRKVLLRLLREQDGPTAVEYAVLLALIVAAVLGAIGAVGLQTGGMWGGIQSDLDATPFGR
jgi:pilus assembly protein Flp/PilA